MDEIDKQLKSLTQIEVPSGMHTGVMRFVNHKKLQPFLFLLLSLLVLNFALIVFHVNNKLVEAEWADMISDLFAGFDMSFSFFEMITSSFFEVVSPVLMLALLSSLTGFIFISIKTFTNQKILRLS